MPVCLSVVQAVVGVLDALIPLQQLMNFGIKKAARLGSLVSFLLSLSPSSVISHWPDCPNTIVSPANNNEDQQDNQDKKE
jgi:hypothetical protein